MAFMTGAARAGERQWERVDVPGARCGDGSQYGVFVSRRSAKRLVFYFQGGGACWNFVTCKALPGFTPMRMPAGTGAQVGFLAGDPARSPVADDSIVYFPYCTADAFAGAHVGDYGWGAKVYHWGSINVALTMKYLHETRLVDVALAERVVAYGFSAGALGAMFSVHELNRYLGAVRRKIAILDSPGLHFGHVFWQKFPEAQLADYRRAMASLGVELNVGDGNLARHAPEVCARFSDWQVGVLQGARDLIMSLVFSTMSPLAHERLVYGPNGLWEATLDPLDNCSAWLPPYTRHTFLTQDWSARLEASGTSALEFARDVIDGYGGLSYR